MSMAPFSCAGRFWRGNLHTHSTRSDGRLPPEAVADFYRDAGYDFLALTDHFWEIYNFPITDTRALRTKSFTTLLGAEIHAPVTSKNHDWHVVAVGLPPNFAPWTSGETMQAMSARAAAAGAFLGIAHPQWYGLTTEDVLSLPLAHAVEVYNHGCAIDCDRGDGFVVLEHVLATGKRLTAYAADDAHFQTPDAGGGFEHTPGPAFIPLTLISSMFMHGSVMHIFGNMLYLWIFGNNVEDVLGHVRFIFFYLVCGVLAGLAHVLFNPNSTVPTVGASGAVAGVLGAYMVMYPKARVLTLVFLGIFIRMMEVPAALLLLVWFVMQSLQGFLSLGVRELSGGVAWFAHIGGFVAGAVLSLALAGGTIREIRERSRYND